MADQSLVVPTLVPNTASAAMAAVGSGKADGTAGNDVVITNPTTDNILILMYDAGGAGGTVLVKAGTGAMKVNQGDITVTLGAGEYKSIVVESARVKAMSGSDAGKIRLDCSANTTVWAARLP
jgi:hypothetical protein